MLNQTIDKFTIQKELGSGGMATVYLAENNIGKKAAIKVLHKKYFHDEQIRKRFVQEAKVMASLEHENICSVISLEDNEEFSAIIMEYLDGVDLKSYVEKYGAVPEDKVMDWLKQIAPALDYAHSKGYVHRDIKPSNFLLTKRGQIKIMDFGIAKAQDSMVSTHTDSKMGSVVYMSPEQIQSPKHVDFKTDIYSLGVTLHHLLSGKIPYDITTQSEFAVMTKITKDNLPLLSVSEQMNTTIQAATRKTKAERPGKVVHLLRVRSGEVFTEYQKYENDETLIEEVHHERVDQRTPKIREESQVAEKNTITQSAVDKEVVRNSAPPKKVNKYSWLIPVAWFVSSFAVSGLSTQLISNVDEQDVLAAVFLGIGTLIGWYIVVQRKNKLSNTEVPLWWGGLSLMVLFVMLILTEDDNVGRQELIPILFFIPSIALFVGFRLFFMRRFKGLALFFWWVGASGFIVMLASSIGYYLNESEGTSVGAQTALILSGILGIGALIYGIRKKR